MNKFWWLEPRTPTKPAAAVVLSLACNSKVRSSPPHPCSGNDSPCIALSAVSKVKSNAIAVLGASGYVGQAFQQELSRRGTPFVSLSRSEIDYAHFGRLLSFLRQSRPEFLINAAGYAGKPNVDACESARADTLLGNVLLPFTVAHACDVAGVPWGHVSSGCIYSGGSIDQDGSRTIERDLMRPKVQAIWQHDPARLHGFTEEDEPNFSFRHPPCSFYSGTKALAEESLREFGQTYIWRLRIPFDECDHARNYLAKVQRYERVYDNVNSLSHRSDFVCACLDLWERRAPFGIYNVTNPGWVTTRQVVEMIQHYLPVKRCFEFFADDADFYSHAARTPRSNCVMDAGKLLRTGVQMRPVEKALEDSLQKWNAVAVTT